MASCGSEFDFNEEYSRTETFDQMFASGTGGVYNASAAIYGKLIQGLTDIQGFRSAITTNGYLNARSDETTDIFNLGIYTENNLPDDIWDNHYGGIYLANRFLILAQEAIDGDSGMLIDVDYDYIYDGYMAEAKVLKAFFYFELLRRYGPVPILTEADAARDPYENDAVNDVEIPTLDELVAHIAELCDEATASDNLATVRVSGTAYGRVIKDTAYMIKARTYMYAASKVSGDATAFNNYLDLSIAESLRMVTTAAADAVTYANMFNPSVTGNYNNTTSFIMTEGGYNHLTLAKSNYPVGFNLGQGLINPTHDLVEAYYKSYMKDMDAEFDLSVENPYSAIIADKRFLATVLYNGETFNSRVLEMYEGGLDASSAFTYGTGTGYYITKFIHPSKGDLAAASGTANVHWIFMRYSEVYLNLAEALFYRRGNSYSDTTEVGSGDYTTTATSMSYLNSLRTSNTRGLTAVAATDFDDDADYLDFLRNEIRVELAFEGHYFFDVKRWCNMSDDNSTYAYTPQQKIHKVVITSTDGGATCTYEKQEIEGEVRFTRMTDYPLPPIETLNDFLDDIDYSI